MDPRFFNPHNLSLFLHTIVSYHTVSYEKCLLSIYSTLHIPRNQWNHLYCFLFSSALLYTMLFCSLLAILLSHPQLFGPFYSLLYFILSTERRLWHRLKLMMIATVQESRCISGVVSREDNSTTITPIALSSTLSRTAEKVLSFCRWERGISLSVVWMCRNVVKFNRHRGLVSLRDLDRAFVGMHACLSLNEIQIPQAIRWDQFDE